MGSDMVLFPVLVGLDGSGLSTPMLQAGAHALNEAHVDNLFVLDVGFQNAGIAHDGAGRSPGFSVDHPVLAPQLILERAVERGLEVLKATLDRSFKDELWSKDGMINREAWATASAVVRDAGILKSDVKYEEIIDMSFVESVRTSL